MQKLLLLLMLALPGWAQNIEAVRLPQASVVGGAATWADVVLDRPATSDDVWVELATDGPVHVPMAVRIPAGQRSARVAVLTDPTEGEVSIAIRATLRGAGPVTAWVRVLSEDSARRM